MRSTLCRLVTLAVLAVLAVTLPAAAEAPIQITVGQPNIWSLEQAHYLLAQMHDRSAALKAKLPSEDILDPAGLQGSRFDMLRTALSADLSFDEVTGTGNRLALEQFSHETIRRRQLQGQLDGARARQAALVTEIAELEARRATMATGLAAGTTTPELRALDATLGSKKAEKTAVDGQVTALTTELATIPTDLTLESSAPGTTATLPTHGLATFLNAMTLAEPKLHPSVVLDNFVQFQYEIIAKQLSLLRDELGPGERLVFLELPHAVYTVPGKADDYLVRASWEVIGYCTLQKEARSAVSTTESGARGQSPATATETQTRHARRKAELNAARLSAYDNDQPLTWEELRDRCSAWKRVRSSATSQAGDLGVTGSSQLAANPGEAPVAAQGGDVADSNPKQPQPAEAHREAARPGDEFRRFRVLDLIPRALAVNMDATGASSKAVDLGLDVGMVGGLGVGLAIQRQQDLAERLVEQQVFAAGFGRGTSIFSWVFAPPPGSRRLHPGDKTTYAVLAVPRDAAMIRLRAEGCFFHRSRTPGEPFLSGGSGLLARWWRDCEDQDFFDLRVPGHEEDLHFVESIAYSGVAPGELLTVILRGRGFSPQTGVLVNGTPLRRSLSLAAETAVPSATTEPAGLYEIVNSEAVILSFSMPAGYIGTPLISLVSPGKVAPINYYTTLWVNNVPGSLAIYSKHHPMFRPPPRLNTVSLLDSPHRVALGGRGFRQGTEIEITINSHPVSSARFRSEALYELDLPAAITGDREWRIRYLDPSTQRHQEETLTVRSPLMPQVTEVQVIRKATTERAPTEYAVLLATSGFDHVMQVYPVEDTGWPTLPPNVHSPRADGRLFATFQAAKEPSILQVCGIPSFQARESCALFKLPHPSAPPPQVHVVKPTSVALGTDGTTVLLRGAHFKSVRTVSFGAIPAEILGQTETEIRVKVPISDTPGPVRILLAGEDQGKPLTNNADLDALFTYEPAKK